MAAETGVPFLGRIPIDLVLGETGDEGRPYVHRHARTEAGGAFIHIVDSILARFGSSETPAPVVPSTTHNKEGRMRIAIPLTGGTLSAHFGHCESFALVDADPAEKKILGREDAVPPPHEPGVLPAWLAERGADMIIAGGWARGRRGCLRRRGSRCWWAPRPRRRRSWWRTTWRDPSRPARMPASTESVRRAPKRTGTAIA